MNEKNSEEPSIVMDLGLSHHYAQVLTLPLRTLVMCHAELKERHFREDKVWEFLYLINQVIWQKV
jgi:hypothetical protein